MHQSLYNLDVVSIMCAYLQDHKALARLARTCKVLCEPALDQLYEEIDSLDHLVRVLEHCSSLWLDDPRRAMRLQRRLDVNEWQTFYSYAKRVRKLSVRLDDFADSDIYEELNRSPHVPLFPLLKTLILDDNLGIDSRLLKFLFVPSLQAFEINAPSGTMFASVGYLRQSAPGIQRLALATTNSGGDFNSTLAADLRHFTPLKHLGLYYPYPSSDVWSVVSQMPHLAELEAIVTPSAPHPSSYLLHPHMEETYFPFSSLAKLTLYGGSMACAALIQTYPLPCLSSFTLDWNTGVPEDDLATSIKVIAANLDSRHMTTLHIHMRTHYVGAQWVPADGVQPPLTFDILRPLTALGNLTSLIISFNRILQWEDSDIAELSSATPRLRTLKLEVSSDVDVSLLWAEHRVITLEGLRVLLANCPALEHLSTTLHAIEKPPSLTSTNIPRNTRIKQLDLWTSFVGDPFFVASLLSRMLPHLTSINHHPGAYSSRRGLTITEVRMKNIYKKWKLVETLLKGFSSRRAYERQWQYGDRPGESGTAFKVEDNSSGSDESSDLEEDD